MGKYPESWIDEEGFSKKTFRLLRPIVSLYQTEAELLWYFENNGNKDLLRVKRSVMYEVENWLAKKKEQSLRAEIARLKERLAPTTPPPVEKKRNQRFENFKEALKDLCRSRKLDISGGWNGELLISNLSEGEEPLDCECFIDETGG